MIIKDVKVSTPLELSEEVLKEIASNCIGKTRVFEHNGNTEKGVIVGSRVDSGVIFVDIEV